MNLKKIPASRFFFLLVGIFGIFAASQTVSAIPFAVSNVDLGASYMEVSFTEEADTGNAGNATRNSITDVTIYIEICWNEPRIFIVLPNIHRCICNNSKGFCFGLVCRNLLVRSPHSFCIRCFGKIRSTLFFQDFQ